MSSIAQVCKIVKDSKSMIPVVKSDLSVDVLAWFLSKKKSRLACVLNITGCTYNFTWQNEARIMFHCEISKDRQYEIAVCKKEDLKDDFLARKPKYEIEIRKTYGANIVSDNIKKIIESTVLKEIG